MSEINATDHKSIIARHFSRDNELDEVDFSIWRYCVHHVWCLNPENMKDFFEGVWDYQAKNYDIVTV